MSKTQKVRRFGSYVRKAMLLLANPMALLAAALFVLSSLAAYVNPAENDLFALAGLFFPLLFFLMLGIVLLMLLLKSKWLWLHLLLLAVTLPVSIRFLGINIGSSPTGLHVINYNVHGFRGFAGKPTQSTHQEIAAYLKAQKADMVCLQEFRSWSGDIAADLETFARDAGYPQYHFAGYWKRGGLQSDGYLILSRFPLIHSGLIPSETKRNIGAFVDIQTEYGSTIRVASIHLISFSLGKKEIEAFGDAAALEMELMKKHGRSLLGKLRNSFNIRAKETTDLSRFVRESPYPLLLCGDFNDTPASYTYNSMRKAGLHDGHRQGGLGMASTYAGSLPFLRIDYCFASQGLEVSLSKVEQLPWSDHFPVHSFIDITQPSLP